MMKIAETRKVPERLEKDKQGLLLVELIYEAR